MKLYYTPGACSLADHITLEWSGLAYEAVRVPRDKRHSAEYLAINPAGAVPALEDGGWILTQNAAILQYIADRAPRAALAGDGTPRSRAEVNRWLGLINSDLHPAFKPLFGATNYLDDANTIEKTRTDARAKLRALFERIDRQLMGREWIAGLRSIADPYLFVVTRWAKGSNVDLRGLDNLERHFRRMHEDAGVRRALAVEQS
ncbi:MAG TPA: glutathione S-transferase N-terminal domain-containing protein [Xanthomonadaceae bacterium]|nr:glutathione S-transferase N-terminal domain-containing protein [Xanthomonadaceae bacterium]